MAASLKEYLQDPFLKKLWDAVRRAGPVRSVSLDLTHVCNLRCKGCYYFEEGMDAFYTEEAEKALDEWIGNEKARGTNFVTIVGGEPSLALKRLKKSVDTISELHENLTILLQEETFQLQQLNLCKITQEIVQTQQQIYPDIRFVQECSNLTVKLNAHAIKQILQNIISNACKYNKEHGYIKIYMQGEQKLCIEDGGVGIEDSEKIFQREYTEHSSGHGIGLDIVQRLCDVMGIEITVASEHGVGTTFCLTFK